MGNIKVKQTLVSPASEYRESTDIEEKGFAQYEYKIQLAQYLLFLLDKTAPVAPVQT